MRQNRPHTIVIATNITIRSMNASERMFASSAPVHFFDRLSFFETKEFPFRLRELSSFQSAPLGIFIPPIGGTADHSLSRLCPGIWA
jgi:hypothetical protein